MVSPLMSLSCVLEAEDVDGLELEPDPDDPEPGGADSTTWTALPSILPLSESSFILSCNTRPKVRLYKNHSKSRSKYTLIDYPLTVFRHFS